MKYEKNNIAEIRKYDTAKWILQAENLSSDRHLLSGLTPWSRVLFEKLTSLQLVKKFLAFYGT
jgi:hypothetical protein